MIFNNLEEENPIFGTSGLRIYEKNYAFPWDCILPEFIYRTAVGWRKFSSV